jgi:hypothetical protein
MILDFRVGSSMGVELLWGWMKGDYFIVVKVFNGLDLR